MKIRGPHSQTDNHFGLPFIQVYGFYIIFHGEISPGGSFARGHYSGSWDISPMPPLLE